MFQISTFPQHGLKSFRGAQRGGRLRSVAAAGSQDSPLENRRHLSLVRCEGRATVERGHAACGA